MKKQLYLFRHAKAVGSDEDYGDRIMTAEILPDGIPPIRRMAHYLNRVPASTNYSSPFIRCRQTAQIITDETAKEFKEDARLQEYVPGTESFDNVGKRVQSFLLSLQSTAEDHVLICTHGIVIAAIKHLVMFASFTKRDWLDYPVTGELWILKGKDMECLNFNTAIGDRAAHC